MLIYFIKIILQQTDKYLYLHNNLCKYMCYKHGV